MVEVVIRAAKIAKVDNLEGIKISADDTNTLSFPPESGNPVDDCLDSQSSWE